MKNISFHQLHVKNGQKNLYFRIFLLAVMIVLNIFLLLIATTAEQNSWITIIAILSILQLVINVLLITKLDGTLFSLPVLFLLFSWIFHFGNIIIIGFDLSSTLTIYRMTDVVPSNIFRDTVEFALYVQSFVAFGMFLVLFFSKKYETTEATKIEDDKNYLSLIKNIGIILFIIGIVPTLYIDIGKLILFMNSGYLATYSLEQSGPLIVLARLFKVGIIMLIIGNKNNPKMATAIFILIVVYQLFAMLSGNRGRAVIEIIVLFYIYTNMIYRIRFKNILLYGSLGYLLIIILNAMSIFRLNQSPNLEGFMNAITESLQTSPIMQVLSEFGATIITACYSLMFFSGDEFIQYGKNYLYSFITIFPNVGGIYNAFYEKTIFVMNFPESYRKYLGGSYIGELFYSMKKGGIPFSMIIGIFISFFSQKIKQARIQKKYILLSIYMIIFPDIIWWIRGYFIEIIRYPIWIAFAIYVIYNFLNRKSISFKIAAKKL